MLMVIIVGNFVCVSRKPETVYYLRILNCLVYFGDIFGKIVSMECRQYVCALRLVQTASSRKWAFLRSKKKSLKQK